MHIRNPANMPLLISAEVLIPDELIKPWQEPDGRTQAILGSTVLSREKGDNWLNHQPAPLAKKRTAEAALQVPSGVIPQEWNYLINPAFADFGGVRWSAPLPFDLDPRLLWPGLRS